MATTMIHVRIDEEVKEQATEALSAMGLSVSDAVRVLLTRIASEKALPFAIKVPNAKTLAAMQETESENLPRFDSVQDLFDDLEENGKK